MNNFLLDLILSAGLLLFAALLLIPSLAWLPLLIMVTTIAILVFFDFDSPDEKHITTSDQFSSLMPKDSWTPPGRPHYHVPSYHDKGWDNAKKRELEQLFRDNDQLMRKTDILLREGNKMCRDVEIGLREGRYKTWK